MDENTDIDVSVIVPVYNASAHLERCVGSILHQTAKGLEVILVDDGSTDGSGRLCDAFASSGLRVRALHIKNSGPGEARNAGIEAARGRFIGFVDADDRAEPEMFKTLYDAVKGTGSDLAFCDYVAQTKNGNVNTVSDSSGNMTYDGQDIKNRILPYFFGYEDGELSNYKNLFPFADYRSYVWLGLYRASVIKENHLRFKSQREIFNEDNLFNLDFILNATRITYVAKCLYYYRDCEGSLTKRYDPFFLNAKLNRYAYLSKVIELYGLDGAFNRRLKNKIRVESVNIINYYVNSGIGIAQKYKKVRETVSSPLIKEALGGFKPLKLSALTVFLTLEKIKAYPLLMIISYIRHLLY